MKKMSPQEIEKESFRIIESEAGDHSRFSDDEWSVVRRIIHATADFDYIKTVRIHLQAIKSAISSLRNGCLIYTDTGMLAAGISKKIIEPWGCRIISRVSDEDVRKESEITGETRSAIAIRQAAPELKGAIIAIGNAPTALHEAITLCEQGKLKPALIIGMPVGFVEALESKERLSKTDIVYITNLDRKGGTPATVAAVNALIQLAMKQ